MKNSILCLAILSAISLSYIPIQNCIVLSSEIYPATAKAKLDSVLTVFRNSPDYQDNIESILRLTQASGTGGTDTQYMRSYISFAVDIDHISTYVMGDNYARIRSMEVDPEEMYIYAQENNLDVYEAAYHFDFIDFDPNEPLPGYNHGDSGGQSGASSDGFDSFPDSTDSNSTQKPDTSSQDDDEDEMDDEEEDDELGRMTISGANYYAEGDEHAILSLKSLLEGIQADYNVIHQQLMAGSYQLAASNVQNMMGRFATLYQRRVELPRDEEIAVTFTGLPTDGAVRQYNELEEELENNHKLLDTLTVKLSQLNAAIDDGNYEVIENVWRAMYQSMLDWTSPPAWYEIPLVFTGWYQQSQEHAAAIDNPARILNRLRVTRAEFRELKRQAQEYQSELLDEKREMNPVMELHNELHQFMNGLRWASFVPSSPY